MPYYKVTASTSDIIEAKDEDEAINQMASIIREFERGNFSWKIKEVEYEEDSFPSNPGNPGIGFPLVE